MSTRAEWSKTGLKLVLNVDTLPAPRPRQVFALPDLSATGHPFLTLSLLDDPDIGPRAIVVTVDATLPETGGHWTLRWKSGASDFGRQIVGAGAVFQLNSTLPLTTYAFHLEHLSEVGGKLTRYSDAVITTPRSFRIPNTEEMHDALGPYTLADGVRTQYLVRSNVRRTNLIKRSRDYAHASWTKFAAGAATVPVVTANAGLASDGTMSADRITFNRGGETSGDICTVSQNVTSQTIGSPYAPSIELKSNTGANQQVMIYWGGLAQGKGGGTITNVVTVTPEWQRFYCADLAAASTITIQFGTRVTYGDQVLDILVGDSQVETGTEPTPAIPTLDAVVSDYGLTGEDWRGKFAFSPVPRENIVRYSQDFTQPSWAKRGTCTATGNNIPGPDGNPGSGDTIAGLGAIYTNDMYQSCVGVTGSHYEPSFWIYKISTSGTLRLQNTQGGSGRWDIDLALLSDGWSKVVRGHAALTVVQEFVCTAGSIGPSFVAVAGAPLTFGLWQVQMEPGLVATPEILTYSAAVTRTDYTVASGVATFAVAPYQGTILRGLSSNADAVAAGVAAIVAAASLDTKITNLERPGLRNQRAILLALVTAAKAKADAMTPAVAHAALDDAWTTFTANVDPILAASVDSTIVKATFDGWWAAVSSEITNLQGAMAQQAMEAANDAAAIIAAASLDTKITNLERPGLRTIRAALAAKRTSAKAKAQAMVPVVSQAALDAAWTAFTDNVDPILAAATDTTVVKATFDGWWSAVETAVTDLQGAMARQAEATANSALAATIAAGSDGILSRGEKPGVAIDYTTATENHTLLLAKAQSCGVAYLDFSATWGALRDYLQSLSPAYDNTTTDTPINAASWAAVWGAWGSAYTSMLVRIASAAPSTVDGIGVTNQNLTTNAAAPVVDGVTMVAGKVVMLAGQTVKTENGVHEVIYAPPAGAAYNSLPTTSVNTSSGGFITSPALAYDVVSGTTPNDATVAELHSGGRQNDHGEVIYSGFTGTNMTGDLIIKIAPQCDEGAEIGSGSIIVSISTNGGQSYTTAASFHFTQTMQTVSIPLSGVNGADLRVKVRANAAVEMGFDENRQWAVVGILTAYAAIHSVYFNVPQSGAANWSFTRRAGVPNASVWRTRAGTTRPPGSHYLATVATDGGVTITAQEAPYEAPLGKPGSGSALLKRDSGGATSWEARRYGFPNYASGATRALATVYQAATDGWLNLVLSGSYMNDIYVYVGSTNNPTTLIWRAGDDINDRTKYASGLIPIPAGTYYKVANGTYGFETTTLKWYPALT